MIRYSNKKDSTFITISQYLWGSGEMYSVGCFLILFIITISEAKSLPKTSDKCRVLLGDDLINEISSYQNIKEDIFKYVMEGEFKSKTYDELEKFVDMFGSRMSGSQVLEDSIDYMIKLTQDEDLTDIVTEELEVPHWVREQEKITMLEPRSKNIAVLGLGRSVSTPPEGVTSDVVVFSSFEEFDDAPIEYVEGKIVLFNAIYTTYGETSSYRTQGAARAAEKGAVASLVRSITPFSINSPHTGSQYYSENVTKIPTAAITLEDADLINRFYNRGEKVVLNIKMQSSFETKTSRNTLIDLKGTKNPEKLVIVSGHIDSWDVGQGAMDDGGGLFVSWAAPIILKRLNLRPKRTVRAIFWTAEELGLIGAYAYAEKHKNESHNINFIMESDEGTFAPRGLSVAGTQEARCIIAEILKLFESINASTLVETNSPGSDITVIVKDGVPGASLHNANENYFWFHHTEGDTMNVENPEELDLCTAFWTAVAYIIADISVDIPR
ncbi:carboxypeptidase Q-like isoform X1 [Pieris napi]|uniref:carboxypeptidase Q-like isoform X1 n=1 Tax=Pieris napi TaxID=78633 RepID=UPI001FB9138F|nr:carboxypeptidase Q-like isoform X1 [Pieris napi]